MTRERLLIQFNLNVSSSGRQEQHSNTATQQLITSNNRPRSVPGSLHMELRTSDLPFTLSTIFVCGVSNLLAKIRPRRFPDLESSLSSSSCPTHVRLNLVHCIFAQFIYFLAAPNHLISSTIEQSTEAKCKIVHLKYDIIELYSLISEQ